MTDSRAALEEAAAKFRPEQRGHFGANELADFAEQESSSLKLLLRAMCKNQAAMSPMRKILKIDDGAVGWNSFPVELDSSGIPVITPEIMEALKNAK